MTRIFVAKSSFGVFSRFGVLCLLDSKRTYLDLYLLIYLDYTNFNFYTTRNENKTQKLSVIRQRGESGRTCAYQGVRNVCFSENLACFVFLKHSF